MVVYYLLIDRSLLVVATPKNHRELIVRKAGLDNAHGEMGQNSSIILITVDEFHYHN